MDSVTHWALDRHLSGVVLAQQCGFEVNATMIGNGFKFSAFMRITGYIFLLVGFLGLAVWLANSSVPLPRSIFAGLDQKYPDTRMYTRAEVLDAAGSVITRLKDNSLVVIIPASLMLLGGIFIDQRRKRSTGAQPQPGVKSADV